MQEEFFIKQVVERRVLGPVLDVLISAMPRDNLLSSGALELFEYIKKENIKDLIKHLVANHKEKLLSLSYMPTFRDLLLRYDQTNGYTTNMDYYLENEDDGGRRMPPTTRMMEHITVDPSEEEYWNTSDPEDEDEQRGKMAEKIPASNGPSTPSKPLVDYTSDDESDDNTENAKDGESSSPARDVDSGLSGTPPERLSEKRRREEDEEEDLGKLVQNKRRNSSSAASNASGPSPVMTGRRRKSFSSGTGNGTPKKIAISLSPALKTGGPRSGEDS